ncbi:MAG: peptidoglycan-binding protein, partial [Saprospiraceae bacterium]|nr:peptidoglycan-binding protein [Saprospiraceae bacterium]
MNQVIIEKLKAKIKRFEEMMVTLEELFKSDDNRIDAEEQKELDLVQSYIDKVKEKLKMTTDEEKEPTSYSIKESVGKGGKNNKDDAKVIQILLKKNAGHNLVPDGLVGNKTIAAIIAFQKTIFNGWSDGLISPGKQTFQALAKGKGTSDDSNSGTSSQDDNANSGSGDDSSGSSDDSSTTDDPSNGDLPAALGAKSKISASVGQGGKNKPEDVVVVKQILKEFKFNVDPTNSEVDSNLIAAIKKFQQDYVGSSKPDGRVDAGGRTWNKMLGLGRLQGGMEKVAQKYGVEPAV